MSDCCPWSSPYFPERKLILSTLLRRPAKRSRESNAIMMQNDSSNNTAEYDVVIVGGGPVGLLLAYQLGRFGVTACVLEQHEKETQDAYGRAIALFPRTSEQLDQLDLIEPILQLGFACRTSVTYKDGKRV
jgi:heterodisulfide reductase subunit A-like polyferredoxin